MNETRTLADWVAGLRYEDIPEDVRAHARRFILDNFGCQNGGVRQVGRIAQTVIPEPEDVEIGLTEKRRKRSPSLRWWRFPGL